MSETSTPAGAYASTAPGEYDLSYNPEAEMVIAIMGAPTIVTARAMTKAYELKDTFKQLLNNERNEREMKVMQLRDLLAELHDEGEISRETAERFADLFEIKHSVQATILVTITATVIKDIDFLESDGDITLCESDFDLEIDADAGDYVSLDSVEIDSIERE